MSQSLHSSEDFASIQRALAEGHEASKKIVPWAEKRSEDKPVDHLLSDLVEQLVLYCATLQSSSAVASNGYLTANELLEQFSSLSNDELRGRVIMLVDQVGSVITAMSLDSKAMTDFDPVAQEMIEYLEEKNKNQSLTVTNFGEQKGSITKAHDHLQEFERRQKENMMGRSSTKIVLPFVELGVQHIQKKTKKDHNRVIAELEQGERIIEHLRDVRKDFDTFKRQLGVISSRWEALQELVSRISTSLADRRSGPLQPALQQDLERLRGGFEVLEYNHEDDQTSSQASVSN